MDNDLIKEETIRLTQFSHGSGCGCKIAPAVLESILKESGEKAVFQSLLVGNESKDDAAVMLLDDGKALISTTDFFMPIVDDPFDFGRISATNAISDVYAMGGKPVMAIAILGWPVEKLDASLAAKVLEGARQICKEAGIPLAGGHSIDSPEPFFGLSVNGIINQDHIKKNNTAKEGDLIFITKPIGIGILGTASKRGIIRDEDHVRFVSIMTELNKAGEVFGKCEAVNAMTDVTGFGLLGHLIEMAEGSQLSVELDYTKVPLIEGVQKYIDQFCFPDNTYRNWNSYEKKVEGISGLSFIALSDPQTSGGLMVAVSPEKLEDYYRITHDLQLPEITRVPVGIFIAKAEKVISVKEN